MSKQRSPEVSLLDLEDTRPSATLNDMITAAAMTALFETFVHRDVSLSAFLIALLSNQGYHSHPFIQDLAANLNALLAALLRHPRFAAFMYEWMHTTMKLRYYRAARDLTDTSNGWHFSALHTSAAQVTNFRIEDMALRMRDKAPELWDLVGFLLSGNDSQLSENIGSDADEMEYWAALGDDEGLVEEVAEETGAGTGHPAKRARVAYVRQQALKRIKTVVILSIVMHSLSQRCNALAAVNGLFFHSCNTPDKVIKALAHMGISISPSTINYAVRSLSAESAENIRTLGQTLTAAYAYDNFDVKLNSMTPQIEKSTDNLLHLTSGLIFRLDHGVVQQHLQCSRLLWEKSILNPNSIRHLPQYGLEDLMLLHREVTPHDSGLSRRERFNAWQFLHDLVHHGPEYFRQFFPYIGKPEDIEPIPLIKFHHLPARAMDINQSRVDGNIEAIADLLAQGGVGDPAEKSQYSKDPELVDITDHVVLIHGDLSTCERIQSILKVRSIEATPWRRYQFVVYVPGLFHMKMACADAIWRIFIQPSKGRADKTSLMNFVGVLRPKETGKIGSGPKFRQMHEVIGHSGIVLRLDAWRVEASRQDKAIHTLDDFANTAPSLETLHAMARTLASDYVSSPDRTYEPRQRHEEERDAQRENVLLMQQYLLLYEEISFAMNAGDIGRVETLFPPWIALFKATGKHKYATQMLKFLTDLHFVYPEGLRRAIRYNILVNPTGIPMSFRAIDWVVELNNLFTKDTYGGDGSNYTKDRIITESANILVYRSCARNAERNYYLNGLSSAHGTRDMGKTFAALEDYMREHRPNEYRRGRRTEHIISDMIGKGIEAILVSGGTEAETGDTTGEQTGEQVGLDGNIDADDLSIDAVL